MSDSLKKPQFRPALFEDSVFIFRLLREFYGKAGKIYGIAFDPDSAIETIHQVAIKGICIVGKNSCAGAVLSPFPFNSKEIIAYVMFWYFKTPREIVILNDLATRCKEAGATRFNVCSHFPENRIGRFYRRKSIPAVETQYMGEIDKCCKMFSKE